MNIWYINHYATPPSYGLPGRPYSLATNLAKLGHKVTVICATRHHLRQNPAPLGDQHNCRSYEGVDYYHLPTRQYKENDLGRLLNMLDFSRAIKNLSQRTDRKQLPQPDVLIPSCVHPLVFPPSYKLSRKYNAKLIYEVRDIWPLSLVELANVPSKHPIVLWFERIEKRAYRQADAVVSLLPNALEHMAPLGLDKLKFHYIPNGINREEWDKIAGNEFAYCNRMRASDYLALFEELDFYVCRHEAQENNVARESMRYGFPVNEKFCNYNVDDLCVTQLRVALKTREKEGKMI